MNNNEDFWGVFDDGTFSPVSPGSVLRPELPKSDQSTAHDRAADLGHITFVQHHPPNQFKRLRISRHTNDNSLSKLITYFPGKALLYDPGPNGY
jgi:hypothetical protein